MFEGQQSVGSNVTRSARIVSGEWARNKKANQSQVKEAINEKQQPLASTTLVRTILRRSVESSSILPHERKILSKFIKKQTFFLTQNNYLQVIFTLRDHDGVSHLQTHLVGLVRVMVDRQCKWTLPVCLIFYERPKFMTFESATLMNRCVALPNSPLSGPKC